MWKRTWPRALRDSLPISLVCTAIVMTQTHFSQQQHVVFDYVRTFMTQFPVMLLILSIFSRFGYFGAKDWATPDASIWWGTYIICFSGLLFFDFLFPLPWHGESESWVFFCGVSFAFLCLTALVVSIRDALQEQQ
jgi:hypothetical protein